MFKKSIDVKSHQRLSGADRKKLKRTLREKFSRVSESDFDVLIPPKAEITVAKLHNRVTIYAVEDGFPMFFDIDGRGSEFFPTVFSLWKLPEMLPSFTLKGAEVSRYVIGGADLMFPGIDVPPGGGLPPFAAGETWAVKVPGNNAPIAVGTTNVSSDAATRAGLRGKALRITHYYRDTLWESAQEHLKPNDGFLDDVVLEDPALFAPLEAREEEDEEGDASGEVEIGTIDITAGVDALSTEVENSEETHAPLSTEEVDALLHDCLLQALHTTVKDKDLPLLGSMLWSNHVLPCRPEGVTLDLKKSSYKKLSKWLQAESSEGLIGVKEDKYKKESMLISVDRNHPDFTSFSPAKKPHKEPDRPAESAATQSLQVREIYKTSVHVNPIFAALGADTRRLYTAAEAADVVFSYIESENLTSTADKSVVVLNPALCDALYKGAIKKGSAYPTAVHKKDVGPTFVSRMQPHHVVARGGESVVRKGCLKAIQIVTERRQGNKKVTKLSGLETFLLDAEALASELQKKFACSTSVAELPGKKGFEVLIQGGVIDDVGAHLVEQYGVPKRYIEILDKTKK